MTLHDIISESDFQNTIRYHLNLPQLDEETGEEDEDFPLIDSLYCAAVAYVLTAADLSYVDEDGNTITVNNIEAFVNWYDIPSNIDQMLGQATLILIANWFNNRDGNVYTQQNETPVAVTRLLRMCRSYSNHNI